MSEASNRRSEPDGQLQITHNVFELLVQAKRERNRLRAALEIIADRVYPATYSHTDEDGTKHYGLPTDASDYARRILDGEQVT